MSASAGRVLIKPRGVYNPATPYEILDSVFYNGSSYICINDTLGHAPTDSGYWQIFAQGAGVISGAFAGACDSLGSAQVKSVIIPPADNFALQKGVIVGVRFTNTNTFEATSENSIALNVNNTGTLPIYFDGTATPLGDNVVAFGEAAYTHFYQYDGSNWVFIGRSGVQTAEQTPYDSTKSTKAAIDEAQALADTNEANIDAIVNVYGSKNLWVYPYRETTKTENGITFTDNGDGTVTFSTADGGATADTWFKAYHIGSKIPKGRYILNGCPQNGSDSTYSFRFSLSLTLGGAEALLVTEYGNGAEFELSQDMYAREYTGLYIKSGTVITTPKTFKPMIRDVRISDDTYVPYAMTNKDLTDGLQDVTGKVDFLNYGWALGNTDNLDNIKRSGLYRWAYAPINTPNNVLNSAMRVETYGSALTETIGEVVQTVFPYFSSDNENARSIYIRRFLNNAWTPWIQFKGTALS